jgi:hypothetical protein
MEGGREGRKEGRREGGKEGRSVHLITHDNEQSKK